MLARPTNTLSNQLKSHWRSFVVIIVLSLGLIGAAIVIHMATDTPYAELTRDPAATFEEPFFVGFISQFGIIFWAAASVVCLATAWVLHVERTQPAFKNFLATAGILSVVLGLDDAFLVHEAVFPLFGLPEWLPLLIYGALLAFWLIRFAPFILSRTPYLLLAIALIGFGLSIGMDVLDLEAYGIDPYLPEDGTKLIGIIAWFVYQLQVSFTALRARAVSE